MTKSSAALVMGDFAVPGSGRPGQPEPAVSFDWERTYVMGFITRRTILFGDCDPAGMVYTPRISYFVIEAVHDFLTHILGAPAIREIFAMGILPPARALAIEFLAPMTWDEVITIEVRMKELSTTSFTFLVEARNSANELTFSSTLTQVSISPESKRPIPIPQALREALCSA